MKQKKNNRKTQTWEEEGDIINHEVHHTLKSRKKSQFSRGTNLWFCFKGKTHQLHWNAIHIRRFLCIHIEKRCCLLSYLFVDSVSFAFAAAVLSILNSLNCTFLCIKVFNSPQREIIISCEMFVAVASYSSLLLLLWCFYFALLFSVI